MWAILPRPRSLWVAMQEFGAADIFGQWRMYLLSNERLQMTTMRFIVIFTAIAIALIKPSRAEDWYLSAGQDCYGDVNIASYLSAWWSAGLTIRSSGVSGRFHLVAARSIIADARSSTGGIKIVDKVKIDDAQAQSFRAALLSLSNSYKVPVAVDLATSIYSGLALPARTGTAVGMLSAYFFNQLSIASVDAKSLAAFIAKDGEGIRTLSFGTKDHAIFAIVSSEYWVRVGAEQRKLVLYACVYPVALAITEFETKGPSNNKFIRKRGADWGLWDIQDAKWDDKVLRLKEQQPDFVYFEEDDLERGVVVGKILHRLSLIGGPWQRKRPDDAAYSSLYATIEFR